MQKKLKPGLVASYYIWLENGEGLFWFWCFINSNASSFDSLVVNEERTSHGFLHSFDAFFAVGWETRIMTIGQRIPTRGGFFTGDFLLGKFNVTLDCFYGRPVGMLVDSMQGNPDVRVTGNSSWQRAGKSWHHPHSKVPLPMRDLDPIKYIVPCANPSPCPKSISIGSAIFAGLTVMIDQPTDGQTTLSVTIGHI